MANSRILTAGIALVALGGFFGWDSISKTAWAHTDAKVMSIDTECEMSATQYGVLTKTTSTATIDCDLTDAFQNLHPDKSWTVTPKYTAHLLVGMGGAAKPVATTLSVFANVKPGQILKVIQSPGSATRVQLASGIGTGLLVGAAMILGGALLALLGLALKSPKQKAMAMLQELTAAQRAAVAAAAGVAMPAGGPPMPAAAPTPPTPPAPMPRAETPPKRPAYVPPPSPVQPARRAFGRR